MYETYSQTDLFPIMYERSLYKKNTEQRYILRISTHNKKVPSK